MSETPAEIYVGCQIPSKGDRADFGCVGDGEGLKDTPWDAAEDFTGEQGLDVGGCEKDGGPRADQKQTSYKGISISEAFRSPSIDKETDDFSGVGTIAKTRLPLEEKNLFISYFPLMR